MSENQIGVISCASMHEQIKECIASLEVSFRIYPIVPPCTFNLKIDLIRYYIDRSINENDATILAYGICHPEMIKLLSEYDDRVIRFKGSNCYEMFLGKEKYAEFHKKCYWILNKPFFTRFKKDLLAGFEPGTKNSKMLIKDTIKKIVYIRFDTDQLDIGLVDDFASALGLEYEIFSTDVRNLKRLFNEAINSTKRVNSIKIHDVFPKYQETPITETIFENIGEIIYIIDIHSRDFVFISPQVRLILGYNPEEFIDIINDKIIIPLYHEDDRGEIIAKRYKYLITCLNEGLKEPYELEYRMRHKNGDFIWVKESIYANYNKEGIIESFIGKIMDINKRKEAELKLKSSQEKYKEAYKKAEFYNDLISHDINNILQVILSSTAHNERFLESPENLEIIKKNMKTIKDNVMRGAKLVKNVKNLSQLEKEGKNLTKVNVCDTLKKSITFIRQLYPDRKKKIQVDAFDTKIFIQANALLTDLFENTLLNAVRHNINPQIEISIRISQENKKGENYLKMEFMDNGIGIKDSIKEKIFQRGFKEDNFAEGMGLGLSLVKKLIEIYGGKISIKDRVDGDYSKGTNFIFLFPNIN